MVRGPWRVGPTRDPLPVSTYLPAPTYTPKSPASLPPPVQLKDPPGLPGVLAGPLGHWGSLSKGGAWHSVQPVHPILTLQPPPEVPASGHRRNTTHSTSNKRPPSWLARGIRAVSPWLPTFPQRHTGSCEAELVPCLLRAPGHMASRPGSVIRADGEGQPSAGFLPTLPTRAEPWEWGRGTARGVWGSLGPCPPWVGKTAGRW